MIKPKLSLNISEIIKTDLEKTIEKLYQLKLDKNKIKASLPKDLIFADYTSNIAFIIAQELKKSPDKIAKEIAENFKSKLVDKAIAERGYLNFWLNPKVYFKVLANSYERKLFIKQDKTVVCEFGQPNTHKVVHIGHLYSYILGSALANLTDTCGFKVKRVNYQGDIGGHIAKCIYGLLQQKQEYHKLTKLEQSQETIIKRGLFLQNCYFIGNKLYEDKVEIKEKINRINQKLYNNDKEFEQIYKTTRQWSLDYIKVLEKKLNIVFDKYYFESQTYKIGKKIVEKNIGTIFAKDQGAIIFKGEKYGLHTRVFINKYGIPTYEAKDLGLIQLKIKDFKPDLMIITTAKEQTEYFKVVFKTAELIYQKLKGKILHIGFGMVNLKSGKMSSRLNNIITAFDVISETETNIKQSYDTDDKTTEILANSAIKFSFLNTESDKDVFFDFDKSISKEGKSGPYLLYSLVRAKSILNKTQTKYDIQDLKNLVDSYNNLTDTEKLFIRKLFLYPETLKKSLETFSTHHLTQYLFDIAQIFNQNYQTIPIISTKNLQLKKTRLFLTKIFESILESGLNILGIQTVDKL
ncbi:MAG: arginine--tRNA ligase [Patescibacteria group bacterium]|nr:MAG: arginine--tRNA ligase [Patescibacteria group bacterium]